MFFSQKWDLRGYAQRDVSVARCPGDDVQFGQGRIVGFMIFA